MESVEEMAARKIQACWVKYKDTANISSDVCCICIAPIDEKFLLGCGHSFHEKCVLSWLATNKTCPLCRLNIDIQKPEYSIVLRAPSFQEELSLFRLGSCLGMLVGVLDARLFLVSLFSLLITLLRGLPFLLMLTVTKVSSCTFAVFEASHVYYSVHDTSFVVHSFFVIIYGMTSFLNNLLHYKYVKHISYRNQSVSDRAFSTSSQDGVPS